MNIVLWLLIALSVLATLATAAFMGDGFELWTLPPAVQVFGSHVPVFGLALVLGAIAALVAIGNSVDWWSVSWSAVAAMCVPLILMIVWGIVALGDMALNGDHWH